MWICTTRPLIISWLLSELSTTLYWNLLKGFEMCRKHMNQKWDLKKTSPPRWKLSELGCERKQIFIHSLFITGLSDIVLMFHSVLCVSTYSVMSINTESTRSALSHETTVQDFHTPSQNRRDLLRSVLCSSMSVCLCVFVCVCVCVRAGLCGRVCVKLSPPSVSYAVNRLLLKRELCDGAWSRRAADWHRMNRVFLTRFLKDPFARPNLLPSTKPECVRVNRVRDRLHIPCVLSAYRAIEARRRSLSLYIDTKNRQWARGKFAKKLPQLRLKTSCSSFKTLHGL